MFVLGHAAIGTRMVRSRVPEVPLFWIVLGTLLPDLIDKPLYYGLVWATGRRGAALGLVSGTRTFGHTALFLLALIAAAALFHSRRTAAVAWGVATHLFLDNLGDLVTTRQGWPKFDALLFPLRGAHFPVSQFSSVWAHVMSIRELYIGGGEVVGAALIVTALLRRFRQRRRQRYSAPQEGGAAE